MYGGGVEVKGGRLDDGSLSNVGITSAAWTNAKMLTGNGGRVALMVEGWGDGNVIGGWGIVWCFKCCNLLIGEFPNCKKQRKESS